MHKRYIYATIGFALGALLALLVGNSLQAKSGNTYQVYRYGMPSEIVTYSSWSPSGTAIVMAILGIVGLVVGYLSGARAPQYAVAEKTWPALWWDLGCVVLLALCASPLETRLATLIPTLSRLIDPVQIALVAIAIIFGSGTALLAGGAGTLIGTAFRLSVSLSWFVLVPSTIHALEGILVGWLAAQVRLLRLLAAVAVALALGLLPIVDLLLRTGVRLGSPAMRSTVGRELLSIVVGLAIGVLVRLARSRETVVWKDGGQEA